MYIALLFSWQLVKRSILSSQILNTSETAICLKSHSDKIVGHSLVHCVRPAVDSRRSRRRLALNSRSQVNWPLHRPVKPEDNQGWNNITRFQALSKFPAFTARKTSAECVSAALPALSLTPSLSFSDALFSEQRVWWDSISHCQATLCYVKRALHAPKIAVRTKPSHADP